MDYVPRLADARLADLLATFPAVMINGPRAVGKSTTAARPAVDIVRLDEPAQAGAFRADPDAALCRRREPLLLDEWQEVPAVLGAVRRAVDADPRPGRFIVTGSVRAELENRVWPGTGRLIRLNMYGLTEAEIGRTAPEGFLARLQRVDPDAFPTTQGRPRLPDYVEMATGGGFPEARLRNLSPSHRQDWLDSYLDQLLTRDAQRLDPGRDAQKMRAYLHALALNTAGLPLDKTLMNSTGINAKTAAAYDALFGDLFVAEQIPAWRPDRQSRLVHAKKRYVVDPALAASAAGLTTEAILSDPDLLGRMIDTFGMAQLRPELAMSSGRLRPHHLRTMGGRQEVDLVVEMGGGRVVAIEFKAASAVSGADARSLAWLRDQLQDRFVAGAVVHTGPSAHRLGDRLLAVPMSAIWEA